MQNTERKIIFAVLFIALSMTSIANIANASKIDVNVKELIGSESKEINHDAYNNLVKISYDVLNSGSLEYGARVRIDVFNGTKYAATLWSKEETFNPGERKTANLYWYALSENDSWVLKSRLYRAYEIVEIENLTEISGKGTAENMLEISSVRIYDDEIKFRVKSQSIDTVKNVIVYPIKHPRAWQFEQNEIGDIAAGGEKSATIHYETGAFKEREITLVAVSEDGKYYGTKTFVMKKEEGINKFFGRFQDWLGL